MTLAERSPEEAIVPSEGAARRIRSLARLRLVTGAAAILVAVIGLLGADWDIQWHAVVGRDQTFTPPHDLILLGIGLSGIVALVSIVTETIWSRRYPELIAYTIDFLGVLRSSLGSYLVGFGAVCSAVAFPLDTYWHSLYGIDVSLWAPFHVMIFMGSALSTIGTIYLLLSAAHLSQIHPGQRVAMLSYACLVATLGILLSKLSTFLTPALKGYRPHLASVTLDLFPFLLALTAVFVCVLAVRLVPWLGAATLVVAVFLLLLLLVSAFVPPMMTLLVQAEHETYLARASHIGSTIVPLLGQTPVLLLTALSIDGVTWLGRRNRWPPARRNRWVLIGAMISVFLVAGFVLIQLAASEHTARGGGGVRSLVLSLLLSLLLTVPGSLLGNWLALTVDETVQALRW